MLTTQFITVFLVFFTIPFFARRFGKFMPMDAGTALYYMFHVYHICKYKKENRLRIRNNLLKRLFLSSFIYAILGISFLYFIKSYSLSNSYIILFFLCALMANIDERYFILPDLLTIPLLILGFLNASLNNIDVTPIQSAIGSVFGYILPTLSSYIMFLIHPSKMGGGDIKLLSAIGAWLGFEGLIITICFSFIFFVGKVFIFKQKESAYGTPAFLGIFCFFIFKCTFEVQNILIF